MLISFKSLKMIKDFTNKKIENIKIFIERRKSYLAPAFLIGGFIFDFITLRRVDGVFDNAILITHLFIAGLAIVLLFSKDNAWGQRFNILKHSQKIEYAMLFSFGALFSGSIVFYSKSASLASSWPFFLILLVLMLGTEFKRKYFQRLVFQINFYFVALLSYIVVALPVLKKVMGPKIFLASGFLSLFLMAIFLYILFLIDKIRFRMYIKKIFATVISVFLVFNVLYFTNIIPPIPLSLKFSAVYHSVYKTANQNYVATYEPASALSIFRKRSRKIHILPGRPVYVFSSVFAPTNLNTKIYHQWQYFDEVKRKWVDSTRVEISITGGRAEGFRGFSNKRNLNNSEKWRVYIETEKGQKLGKIRFRVLPKGDDISIKEEII